MAGSVSLTWMAVFNSGWRAAAVCIQWDPRTRVHSHWLSCTVPYPGMIQPPSWVSRWPALTLFQSQSRLNHHIDGLSTHLFTRNGLSLRISTKENSEQNVIEIRLTLWLFFGGSFSGQIQIQPSHFWISLLRPRIPRLLCWRTPHHVYVAYVPLSMYNQGRIDFRVLQTWWLTPV